MKSDSTAFKADNFESTGSMDWLPIYSADFEKRLNSGSQNPLDIKRKEALAQYEKLGFPHSKQEEWKYTNPAPIKEKNFPLVSNIRISEPLSYDLNKFFTPELDSIRVTIRNGQIETDDFSQAGLTICSLRNAKKNQKLLEVAERYLANVATQEQAFVAINTTLMEEVLIIHQESNKKAEKPVEVLILGDQNSSEKTILPRILVISEKSSELCIIERYQSVNPTEYCTNSVIEFSVAENATVNHYRVQNESIKAFHISTIAASLESNSCFRTHTFSFGGALVRNEVNLTLNGSNCNVVMNGLTAITGEQHVDNHTLLDNVKPNCESNELYKGIYADKSQGVFSGSIIVRQEAQKTNAIQSNKSLLLSDSAQINSKPQLKIWADDVKCTHGATVGQLDDDAMFYIRSRGVSESDAKVMLVHAFASEVISSVKVKSLQDSLENLLLAKLNLNG